MTQTMTPPAQSGQPQNDQPQYQITDADKKRIKDIQAAWKAYDGDFIKPLVPMDDMSDDNVLTNRVEQIVNTGVDFLFGDELEISAGQDAPKEVQAFLDDTWGDKEVRLPLLQDLAMNGAMAGRAFLRIVPGDDTPKTFRLVAVDPSTVYVQTAPGDCETVLLYCIQYSCMEKVNGRQQQVFYREEISRIDPDGDASKGLPDDDDTWQVQHWTQVGQMNMEPKDGRWIPAGEPYIWPYEFAPMFSCKNRRRPNEFWGKPDITNDLIGVNNAINAEQSDIKKISRLYSHPHDWASGIADQDISGTPGHLTILPPDGKIGSIQRTSDIPSMLQFCHDLRSSMDEQSQVPGVATGRMESIPRGNISGVAIELEFMPMLKKTFAKRGLYGKMIIDVSKALLILNNMSEDFKITLQWQSPLPNDALQQVQAAVLKKTAGVSEQTTLEELGYDYEEELARNQEEDQQKMLAFARGQGMMTDQPPMVPPPQTGDPTQPAVVQPGQPGQSPFVGRQ